MADSPRISPLSVANAPDEIVDSLAFATNLTGGAQNIFLTLAHHPKLFQAYAPFGKALLFDGKLPPRDRELCILRTAAKCNCHYELAHHKRIASTAGLTEPEIDNAIREDLGSTWQETDHILLSACDQLIDTHDINDQVWSALASRFSEAELIELTLLVGHYVLTLLVGHYVMLAGFLNSTKVEVEVAAEPPTKR